MNNLEFPYFCGGRENQQKFWHEIFGMSLTAEKMIFS